MPNNVQTTAKLHSSHVSKVILKILQAMFQQYMNKEFPHVQAGFRKGRGTRDQIANIRWVTEKAKEYQKTSASALLNILNPLTVWITTICGKFLEEMKLPDLLTCLLRNLYVGHKAIVRIRYRTTDWFKIGKGVYQGCCHPAYLTSL